MARLRASATWLSCALTLASGAFAEAPSDSARLSLLSYNIHGLPHLVAKDEPKRRMPFIAQVVGAYDVALLQEDFEYGDVLRAAANESHEERGNGPTLRWGFLPLVLVGWPLFGPCWLLPHCSLPQGSGLATYVMNPAYRVERLEAEAYGACRGWLSHANDCLGNKGYLGVRLTIASGLEIDVYNTHLDAGFAEPDRNVRATQLARLGDAISKHSLGRAVIVAGDLNSRLASSEDFAPACTFAERIGARFADTRTEGAWPEHLDYILYRPGSHVSLELERSGEDTGLVYEGGLPLSDHPGVFASFRVAHAPLGPTQKASVCDIPKGRALAEPVR